MRPILQLFVVLLGLVVVPLVGMLLAVAATGEGRSIAMGLCCALGAMAVAAFGRKASRGRRGLAMALGVVSLGLGGFVVWRAPEGGTANSARVQAIGAGAHVTRDWGLARLMPEVDQLMLAYSVASLTDPLFTSRQAAALRQATREIYRELEADGEFHALGSAMGLTYADLRREAVPEHAYLYVPATLDRTQSAPALVFLHGSGGNFKAYLWILATVADRLNAVVIAPSGGLGRWTPADTRGRVEAALAAARERVKINPTQLHAVGLSNGGLAVSHLLADGPDDYRSFIFISPVFGEIEPLRAAIAATPRKPAVFVLTGAYDDRVPLEYVRNATRRLQEAGAGVTSEVIPDADHFLFYSQRALVATRLEHYLRVSAAP